MDRDNEFLDNLDDIVHNAWCDSKITNTLRSLVLAAISDVRDEL